MNLQDQDIVPDLEDVPDLLDVDDQPTAGPSRQFDRPKVPITLLTGYLGAGKSTLLEYILTANHGYKIAVCMNDFGDTTDIEAKSLTLSDPTTNTQTSEFLSLPNGCLCCSVKDLGIAAIEEMVAAQKGGVDWVLVELTGVADPTPIAKSFWANEEMGDLILDGIICVVDCRNILKQLGEKREDGINEAQKQLASSDVILLNKTDLVTLPQLEEVERAVKSLNPTLRIHKTVKSQIDLKELFGLNAYTSAPSLDAVEGNGNVSTEGSGTEAGDGECHEDHDHTSHEHGHAGVAGVHNSGITTISIPLPVLTIQQYDRLERFLEDLLWSSRLPENFQADAKGKEAAVPEILRTKGFILVKNSDNTYPRRVVLQGVTDLFELTDLPETFRDLKEGEEGQGKVVFIGRGVDGRLREALLESIQV